MNIINNKLKFDFETQQLIIRKISEIEYFNGKWGNLYLNRPALKEMPYNAIKESVFSALRQKGHNTDEMQADKLLSTEKNKPTPLEQEAIHYHKTLAYIHKNNHKLKLSESKMLQLFETLTNKDIPKNTRNYYKTTSKKTILSYPAEVKGMIFDTTQPHLVKHELAELMKWKSREAEKKHIHPLLITAAFVYEFLSIYPFGKQNRNMAMLLTNYLLLEYGYNFVQYVWIERVVEKNLVRYLKAIVKSQRNRYSGLEKIDQWTLMFLDLIIELIAELEVELKPEKTSHKNYLNDRQKRIKRLISIKQPVKIGDIQESLPHFSRNTIKKDLQFLKTAKMINSEGKNKGTIYFVS